MHLHGFIFCLVLALAQGLSWPVPYKDYSTRPPRDERCQTSPHHQFCPGEVRMSSLDFDPNDEIDIFVLTKPALDFQLTAMDFMKGMKVGLALYSRKTSKTYTVTYSPLSSVLDATVPLLFPGIELLWCNQAAVCFTANDVHGDWSTRQRVGVIGGDKIDNFIVWSLFFNNTRPFFETFNLMGGSEAQLDGSQIWMMQMDGTRFFLQALSLLKNSGAVFYGNSTIHLSSFSIYCQPPQYLGPPAQVQKQNPGAFKEAKSFFENLQPSNNVWKRFLRRMQFEYDILWKGEFFYLFNEALWKLKLVSPRLENKKMTVLV